MDLEPTYKFVLTLLFANSQCVLVLARVFAGLTFDYSARLAPNIEGSKSPAPSLQGNTHPPELANLLKNRRFECEKMFQFVTVTHPGGKQDKKRQKSIRQHAIRSGIQSKRVEIARQKENFVSVEIDTRTGKPKKRSQGPSAIALTKSVSVSRFDPFDTLPGDGERLRTLMRHETAKQAGEPVFCVEDAGKIYFDGMDTVLKGALSDPTMFHALSLVLSLAANRDVPNVECLAHRGAMLQNLRARMGNPKLVPTVSTLTAMLLLISYEYRVDGSSADSIAVHIRAVRNVLDMTKAENIAISDALRRSLFWQDLYSCLFVGTPRLLSHKDYAAYLGIKRQKSAGVFVPLGFQPMVSSFPVVYTTLLKDLSGVCRILDTRYSPDDIPMKDVPVKEYIQEYPIDNVQYCIESRLVDLLFEIRNSDVHDGIYEACIFATFLCTYMLSTGIWEGCFIPEFCITQILGLVSRAEKDTRWREWRELLLWLLFMSGACSRKNATRKRAINMIRVIFREHLNGTYDDWKRLKLTLRTFIWSSYAMEEKCQNFWNELRGSKQLHSQYFGLRSKQLHVVWTDSQM